MAWATLAGNGVPNQAEVEEAITAGDLYADPLAVPPYSNGDGNDDFQVLTWLDFSGWIFNDGAWAGADDEPLTKDEMLARMVVDYSPPGDFDAFQYDPEIAAVRLTWTNDIGFPLLLWFSLTGTGSWSALNGGNPIDSEIETFDHGPPLTDDTTYFYRIRYQDGTDYAFADEHVLIAV
jgi:hypothetical protein